MLTMKRKSKMKSRLLILTLFIPSIILAQDSLSAIAKNDQTYAWMTEISSNSEMRIEMMDLMIQKTSGNEEEMMKIVRPILSNKEMNEMIMDANYEKRKNNIISVEPRGIMKVDSTAGKGMNVESNLNKK